MMTTLRNFKRCVRSSLINGNNRKEFAWNLFQDYGIFNLITNGLKSFMLIVTILSLCLKIGHNLPHKKTQFKWLHNKLWTCMLSGKSMLYLDLYTRDFRQRKVNYPRNHRYGLKLQTNRKLLHVILCILLACDMAMNQVPGFSFSKTEQWSVSHSMLEV